MSKSIEAIDVELTLASILTKESLLSIYRNRESILITTIQEALAELPEVRKVQDELVTEINELSTKLGIKHHATAANLKLELGLKPEAVCATKPYRPRTHKLERMVAPIRPTAYLTLQLAK